MRDKCWEDQRTNFKAKHQTQQENQDINEKSGHLLIILTLIGC